ncbi:hypothetical protein ACFVAV_21560 [Nocardia sp. NPDC057663]|uniref:hypothetical protein n=1 Tax=Nocardia sp. NPDC057663 TaxID=3346201 RepID=UPI003672434B
MVKSTLIDVASKVTAVRKASANDPVALSRFPPGSELDTVRILEEYCEEVHRCVDCGDVPALVLTTLESLRIPTSLIELNRITSGPSVSGLSIGSRFAKGDIMDEDGEVYRIEEHWINVGIASNDTFLLNLTTEEVMFSDQYFWRYGEGNRSRVVAPDMLTFVNEYMFGAKYVELVDPSELEDPEGWYATLVANGWA